MKQQSNSKTTRKQQESNEKATGKQRESNGKAAGESRDINYRPYYIEFLREIQYNSINRDLFIGKEAPRDGKDTVGHRRGQ
ncbi:MAG: hypothetical protein FWE59_01415 [Oscillospiraceae bacterium]|nr:hypothetical protein [Oscillospiraceae bacterium]